MRDDGAFVLTLTAPRVLGIHTLTVRDAATQRVIDGAQFTVNRGEARKEGAAPRASSAHEEDERAGQRVRIRPPVRRR